MIRHATLIAALLLAPLSSDALSRQPESVPVLVGDEGVRALLNSPEFANRPVVVHFFATWCGPCREEMPKVRKLIARAESRGAKVVLLSLDEPKDESKVRSFLDSFEIRSSAFLLDAPDPKPVTKMIDPEWSASLPATFVFKNGKRTASVRGPLKNERVLDEALK